MFTWTIGANRRRTILLERDATIATVVLNRPEKLNALTKEMWRRLGEAVAELGADDGIRCVVLRGAGGKAFAPGNDISEFETERHDPESAKVYGAVMHATLAALGDCRHPTVALIEGICVGGGLEIASLCDIRICGESSRFGVPVNRLGLVMAHAELGGDSCTAAKIGALEIDIHDRVIERLVALLNREALANTGAVDKYVEPTESVDGVPDHRFAARHRSDIARRCNHPLAATQPLNASSGGLSSSPVHRDPRAGIMECLGCRPAYSATATRDQNSFFVEHCTPRFGLVVGCSVWKAINPV